MTHLAVIAKDVMNHEAFGRRERATRSDLLDTFQERQCGYTPARQSVTSSSEAHVMTFAVRAAVSAAVG
jgi:hypothetical protein